METIGALGLTPTFIYVLKLCIAPKIGDMRGYRGYRRRSWPSQYPYDPRYWAYDPRYWATKELGKAWGGFIMRMYFPGSRSTAGGRSHLPQLSLEAKAQRRGLAWQAYDLRVCHARSIRSIAEELGVAKSVVGRWLEGVPRVKQD